MNSHQPPSGVPATDLPEGLRSLQTAAEQLWLDAQAWCPALSVEVLPQVDSTNTHVLQLGKAVQRAAQVLTPVVAVAWEQTAGRGRHGRQWWSQPQDTLKFSLGYPVRLDWTQPASGALSLAMGVAVCEALKARWPDVPLGLKWPNDVWVQGRKLAGLLLEVSHGMHAARPDEPAWLVVGLGLNVSDVPADLLASTIHLQQALQQWSPVATSLVSGPPITPGDVLRLLVPAMLQAVTLFERSGFAAFQSRFDALDALRGQSVTIWPTGQPPEAPGQAPLATGVALGVTPDGAMKVMDDHGHVQFMAHGEVSVRTAREN